MTKYVGEKIEGFYLYFTSKCVLEPMHVHITADERLAEKGSAKFWVRSDGSVKVADRGRLTEKDVNKIKKYIKEHYEEMYLKWSLSSSMGFYNKE